MKDRELLKNYASNKKTLIDDIALHASEEDVNHWRSKLVYDLYPETAEINHKRLIKRVSREQAKYAYAKAMMEARK